MKKSRERAQTGERAKSRTFSTSEGRANLARALATTEREKTIVGFDRYRRPVAALVPTDAVRMLAGEDVAPAVRDRIVRMARLFVAAMDMAQVRGRAKVATKGARKTAKKGPARKSPARKRVVKRKAKAAPRRKALGKLP